MKENLVHRIWCGDNMTKTTEQRFWDKVNRGNASKCWNWVAGFSKNGYGNFKNGDKWLGSHCMSWILTKGKIPKGNCVLHKCDNRKCVNPSHLFLGTRADNAEDRDLKGRTSRGETHYIAKLSKVDVNKIRNMYLCGTTQQVLSDIFGVCRPNISMIVNRVTWKG